MISPRLDIKAMLFGSSLNEVVEKLNIPDASLPRNENPRRRKSSLSKYILSLTRLSLSHTYAQKRDKKIIYSFEFNKQIPSGAFPHRRVYIYIHRADNPVHGGDEEDPAVLFPKRRSDIGEPEVAAT